MFSFVAECIGEVHVEDAVASIRNLRDYLAPDYDLTDSTRDR